MLVILRSEVRKDLVLLVVLSASEESGFDVILSVSEGSRTCFSSIKNPPQILHAFGIQNDTPCLSS